MHTIIPPHTHKLHNIVIQPDGDTSRELHTLPNPHFLDLTYPTRFLDSELDAQSTKTVWCQNLLLSASVTEWHPQLLFPHHGLPAPLVCSPHSCLRQCSCLCRYIVDLRVQTSRQTTPLVVACSKSLVGLLARLLRLLKCRPFLSRLHVQDSLAR